MCAVGELLACFVAETGLAADCCWLGRGGRRATGDGRRAMGAGWYGLF